MHGGYVHALARHSLVLILYLVDAPVTVNDENHFLNEGRNTSANFLDVANSYRRKYDLDHGVEDFRKQH